MTFNKIRLKRWFNDNRRSISLVLPFFLVAGVFLTVYLVGQRQELRREAVGEGATLSLSPDTGTYDKDETFDVNILLNTDDKPVVGVDVSLSFDSSKLLAQSVTPGTAFQEQITFKNEINDGKILLSLGSLTPFTGAVIYGTVRFRTIGVGEATVTFDETPFTKVAQQGGGDILGETGDGTYTITGPATPTPTPEPTVAPTPTPTTTLSQCQRECQTNGYSSGICRTSCYRGETDIGNYCNNRRYRCCCSSAAAPTPTPTPTPSTSISCDMNGDGRVNTTDYDLFISYYQRRNRKADLDHDGRVNISDYSLFVSCYQQYQ